MTILFSIAPDWIEMIVRGDKRYELRRRPPRGLEKGTDALLYATAPTSAVVAKASLGEVVSASPDKLWDLVGGASGCSRDFYDAYFAGRHLAHAIPLFDAAWLPAQVPLKEMKERFGLNPPQAWMRVPEGHPILEMLAAPGTGKEVDHSREMR